MSETPKPSVEDGLWLPPARLFECYESLGDVIGYLRLTGVGGPERRNLETLRTWLSTHSAIKGRHAPVAP